MGWLLRDERKMRRHRPPAQHHDPPLGWTEQMRQTASRWWDVYDSLEPQPCGDCGWTPEGVWEPCSEHEGEEEPR